MTLYKVIGASVALTIGAVTVYYANLAFWHMVGIIGRWYWGA